jgi:hypothetical protein
LESFLKIAEVDHAFGLHISTVIVLNYFFLNVLGHILGDFFHKLIWSPCYAIPLFRKEVDIAMGAITITGPRLAVVDFSVSYYETDVGFLAHVPRDLSKWAALLRPYQVPIPVLK